MRRRNPILLVLGILALVGGYFAFQVAKDPNYFKPQFYVQQVKGGQRWFNYEVVVPLWKNKGEAYQTGIWIPPGKNISISTEGETQPFIAYIGDVELFPTMQKTPTKEELIKNTLETEYLSDETKGELIRAIKMSNKPERDFFGVDIKTVSHFIVANEPGNLYLDAPQMLSIGGDKRAVGDSIELYISIRDNDDLEKMQIKVKEARAWAEKEKQEEAAKKAEETRQAALQAASQATPVDDIDRRSVAEKIKAREAMRERAREAQDRLRNK